MMMLQYDANSKKLMNTRSLLRTFISFTSAIAFLLIGAGTKAQTPINRSVEVVKPYEPVVTDANKINVMPKINDSVTIKPNVQYNVVPTAMNVEYQVNPINAAKMVSMPVAKLYKSYMKLGFGNYATPEADLYINSLRSKTHTLGLLFQHRSSAGNVTLENDKDGYAGYSNTSGELFGKRFLKSSYLYGNLGFNSNKVYDYGYNTRLIRDTTLEKGDIRQNYFGFRFKGGVQSTLTDTTKLNYHAEIGYNYFQDRFTHRENNLNLNGQFFQQLKRGLFGLNTSLNILSRNGNLDTTGHNNTLFQINPWMGLSSDQYRLQFGLNIAFEGENGSLHLRMYPKADFQFVAVKDVIIPFLGISGQPVQHSYRDIASENPFMKPDLLIKNANLKLNFYGGLKGSLGSKASYIAKFDYSSYNNQYFWVNDTARSLPNVPNKLQNLFTVVYSNTDMYTGTLEINYDYSDSWHFGVKTNLYGYNLTDQPQAWHKPPFDLTLSAHYNLRNKILVDFDVIGLGKRKVKTFETATSSRDLESVLDFNLGLEYRYTKILSFWMRFNNFTASRYYMWNQYPAQRFNMMAGFTYSL